MCDAVEDMDEFIEYEYSRDCIELEEDNDGAIECNGDHLPAATSVSVEHQDEEFLYLNDEDYEIVEALEDEDDESSQHTVDIKTEIVDPEDNQQVLTYRTEMEMYDDDDVEEHHLIEDDDTTENVFEEYQELRNEIIENEESEDNSPEFEKIVPEKRCSKVQSVSIDITETEKKPTGSKKRYMLFDELVACIVDYDPDGTPIVEFSISSSEADEKLPVECGICPEVMARSKIAKHLKTHLVPGTNRYQCIYCEETYKDSKYLAGHARRHMGIRPYVCEICKLYFSTKQDLRVHNQRRHQEKDHICEVCGKTFAQNTQLKRHREATHEKKRRFKCDHCPKSYYKNFSLQEHVRAVHMGKRRMIVCPFCGMQCRDAHKMARHRKQMHLHQSHFECHICSEEFTDINYFDAHKRSIQCRNNTRRKLEQEALLKKQQEREEQVQQYQQQHDNKADIILQTGVSNENYITCYDDDDDDDDDISDQMIQIGNGADIKYIIPQEYHNGQTTSTQEFILNNDLLQHHKIELLTGDEEADDDELVYEITIDGNE